MKIIIVPFLILLLFKIANCQNNSKAGDEKLVRYLTENYMSPEDYIIKNFKNHQIIFLGEFHRIKQDVKFVQNILPQLYKNGIYFLATEFARQADQYLIDSLINSPEYNQALAERIALLQYVYWGYKEYADIYKSAWQLNQAIPPGHRRFRIIGINGPQNQNAREKDWAKVIFDEILDKNEKALVYCGSHHAFTEYLLPIYNIEKDTFYRFEDDRVGRYIYNKIGKKAITVFLHSPWQSDGKSGSKYVQPVNGKIEQILALMPKELQRIGFDVKNSPFANLKSTNSFYKYGYPDFCLADFCDGYIFQGQIKELEGVTVIENFINENNFILARNLSKGDEKTSINEFMEGVRSFTDIKKRFENVK